MTNKQTLDLAVRLADQQIKRADSNASEVWRLRNAIRRALELLKVGRIDQARIALEQVQPRKKQR